MKWFRLIASFLLAVLVCAVPGSLIQTQINLAALGGLGVSVSGGTRLETSFQDLVGFAPIYSLAIALAFLIAFLVAGGVARLARGGRLFLYPLAGGVAVVTMLAAMNWLTDITPIAAARTTMGVIALALPGLLGGAVFAMLTRRSS